VVQGPKGQVQAHLPAGVKLKQADGNIQVTRTATSTPLFMGWRAPW